MAKMTRNALKGIVKECLVEILQEGISQDGGSRVSLTEAPRKRKKRPVPDPIMAQAQFESTVADTVNNLTSDPIMASIFADTARTTLQEQLGNEGPRQGPGTAGLVSGVGEEKIGDPSLIFGESAANWSTLAFADNKSK